MSIIPFQRGLATPDEVTRDRAQLVTLHSRLSAETDSALRARLLGQIGELHYRLGRAEDALPVLREAVILAEATGDARLIAAQRLRLATGLQYANRHSEAEAVFREGLAGCSDPLAVSYTDFFQQHLGKCLVEMGRLSDAIVCFEAALALRLTKDDTSLIASTNAALSALHELLDDAMGGRDSHSAGSG